MSTISHEPRAQPGSPPYGENSSAVLSQAGSENFPVASRLLPKALRADLMALYGFARLVDDIGDEHPGDRTAALEAIERDLQEVFTGTPEHPLLVRLQHTVACHDLPKPLFQRLIEANRVDQLVSRYERFEDLASYCALSANPVGELVLGVFGAATPERIRRSDAICTGLQLVEHWQDVREDSLRGRIYLPQSDLKRFGVAEADLQATTPTPQFKALMAFEVARAHELLTDGAPLITMLRGRLRFAVAAFAAGGRAALRAIERADYDVLGARPRPGRLTRAGELARALGTRRQR